MRQFLRSSTKNSVILNEAEEEWYFSIIDVVGVLTEQSGTRRAATYWAVLKNRLKKEGANQLLTNCKQLKLKAADGNENNHTKKSAFFSPYFFAVKHSLNKLFPFITQL